MPNFNKVPESFDSDASLNWENDEILREVYAIRDAYGAEHSNDLARIYADLKQGEETTQLSILEADGTITPPRHTEK